MRATLKRLILKHVKDQQLLQRSQVPLQVLDVCRRIQWDRQITVAFEATTSSGTKPDLQTVARSVGQDLKTLTGWTRRVQEGTTPLRAAQLAYLTATLLELRDTTAELLKDNPTSRSVLSFVIRMFSKEKCN
ncbi:uncharacterized protein [Cherax quadricarinatus]|uniref:uncharacterized protein n=1 Tax=Cherax quadricarinatus TaxID=27406 RepID=UPI002377D841|nr:uncharacterized protein LOC128689225 [Cherax quadricarinatus]